MSRPARDKNKVDKKQDYDKLNGTWIEDKALLESNLSAIQVPSGRVREAVLL